MRYRISRRQGPRTKTLPSGTIFRAQYLWFGLLWRSCAYFSRRSDNGDIHIVESSEWVWARTDAMRQIEKMEDMRRWSSPTRATLQHEKIIFGKQECLHD